MLVIHNKQIFSVLLIFLFFSCEPEKNPVQVSPNPVIESISVPARWNTRSDNWYKVEVQVRDAQGFSDIARVQLEVIDPTNSTVIFADSLHDDAGFYYPGDGDVVAGDGVYSTCYQTTQIVPALASGNYVFQFMAGDRQGNRSQIYTQSVLFGPNYAPVVTGIFAADTLALTQDREIIRLGVADPDGISDIARVYLESKSAQGLARIYESDFFNDGDLERHGDLVADDSIYSVRLDSSFFIGKQGSYILFFHVMDSFSEKNVNVPEKQVFVGNTPPQLVSIVVPDTMHRPTVSGVYNRKLLTAQVNDGQGLTDIDSVYFFSRKPDSTLANNGQPILLVDNGLPFNPNNPAIEAGDQQAGDGRYSFSLMVFSDTAPGEYIFTFYARDKAGNLSAAQIRKLEITGD